MLSPLLPDSILDYTWQDFDDVLTKSPDIVFSYSASESQNPSTTKSGLLNGTVSNVQQSENENLTEENTSLSSKTETQQPSTSSASIISEETVPSDKCKQNSDSNVISDQVNSAVPQPNTCNTEKQVCNSRTSATRYSLRDKKTKISYQEEENVNEDHFICK